MLLSWYDAHRRRLPWRAPPGQRSDPYRVWLSEIMLQQTTVATVAGYFEAFLRRWPSLRELAAAPLDDVLHAWAGLGYYSRARNLHACASAIVARHDGTLPSDIDDLRALPGIGAYTAAAIAAIAFDISANAVDGNVERVVARLHAIETPMPDAKPLLRAVAARLVPQRRAGDYIQAMMDLGATICGPREPRCVVCPLFESCAGRKSGIAAALPRKRPKAARPTRRGVAFVVRRRDGAILLRRRPPRGLLGGLIEVASSVWRPGPLDETTAFAEAPFATVWHRLPGEVRHVFTHFGLELQLVEAKVPTLRAAATIPDAIWCLPDKLDEMALPTVMKKILAVALATPPPTARRR